jgi:hypothetical protein
MGFEGVKNNLLLLASILVLIFYGISFTGVVYEPLGPLAAKLVNKEGAFSLTKGETLIEWIEAIFWLFAFSLYLTLFVLRVRSNRWDAPCSWFLFLALLCFVALGEETSWGQHIFGFDSPDYIKQINKQRETNIHNLKLWLTLPSMLGLSKDSIIYPYLKYVQYLPQFGFFLVCGILWIAMPIFKWTGTLSQRKAIQTFPFYSKAIAIFFAINIIVYAIIDTLFFDVGEVFELAVSTTALISALDLLLLRSPAQTVSERRFGF